MPDLKPKESGERIAARRRLKRIEPLPMEWMDPMSWRLPSGKALAEFALQSGFLAPLILNGPRPRPGKKRAVAAPAETLEKPAKETTDSAGNFRGNQ